MGCFSGSEEQQESSSFLPSQKKGLNKAIDLYLPQLGQNSDVWQGDRVAGLTDLQKNVFGAGSNFLNLFSNPSDISTPLFGETGNAIAQLLSGQGGAQKMSQRNVDDFFKESYQDPAMKTLNQDILPSVDEGYAGTNFFNSAKGKARDRVTTDVMDTLTEQKASLNFNNMLNNQRIDEASAGRMQTAVGQGMNYSQLPGQIEASQLARGGTQVRELMNLYGLGQGMQQQEQLELEAQITKFAEENQITDPQNLSILMRLLGMNMNTSSGSKSGPGLGNVFASSALSDFGSAAGGAASSFLGF